MAWTIPKTNWATGELVTAEDMNAVGENLAELGNLRSTVAVYTTTERITSTPRDFVDVDADKLNLTLTTSGGDVLVQFSGTVNHDSSARSWFDVEVDGERQGGNDGIWMNFGLDFISLNFTYLIQNLSAGAHTFKLQWKSNTGRLNMEPHSQFWVREI